MLLELMDELGFAKNQMLMIGDTSHDLEMARAAEVDSVAVTYGAHAEAGLRACKPLHCFPSVSSLSAWLKQNA
jgi:phosphoglycolate phosphatase